LPEGTVSIPHNSESNQLEVGQVLAVLAITTARLRPLSCANLWVAFSRREEAGKDYSDPSVFLLADRPAVRSAIRE
jgi:hypothetical protein